MITLSNEPLYRLKPIISHNKENAETLEKIYCLQKKIRIGSFVFWINQKTTAFINVYGTEEELILFIEHLSKPIYIAGL